MPDKFDFQIPFLMASMLSLELEPMGPPSHALDRVKAIGGESQNSGERESDATWEGLPCDIIVALICAIQSCQMLLNFHAALNWAAMAEHLTLLGSVPPTENKAGRMPLSER